MEYSAVWDNPKFSSPYGITVGLQGVYLCNTIDNNILLLNQSNGNILQVYNTSNPSFIYQNTAAVSLTTSNPLLYAADGGNSRVVILNTTTNTLVASITNVSGTTIENVIEITLDQNGTVWGTESAQNFIYRGVPNSNNLALEIFPLLNSVTLDQPIGISLDNTGNIYIANYGRNMDGNLMKFSPNGTLLWTTDATAFPGLVTHDNFSPFGISYNVFSNTVWTAINHLLLELSAQDGSCVGVYAMDATTGLNSPESIAFSLPYPFNSTMNQTLMYVADTFNSRVVVFNFTIFNKPSNTTNPLSSSSLLLPIWAIILIAVLGSVALIIVWCLIRYCSMFYTIGLLPLTMTPAPRTTRKTSSSRQKRNVDVY